MAKIDINNGVVKIDGSAVNQTAGAEKVNSLMFRINSGLLEVSANNGTTWSKVAMSPADILTAIKTVDGAGSGLDADLLDGISSGSFVRTDATSIINNILKFAAAGVNGGQIFTETSITDAVGLDFVFRQIQGTTWTELRMTDGSAGIAGFMVRISFDTGATWTTLLNITSTDITYLGNKVWHAGNDGTGSGLDADKLGGVASSSYLLNTQTANKAMMLDQQPLGAARDLNALANLGPGVWSTYASAEANTITNGPANSSLASECVVLQYDMGSAESTTYIVQELFQKRTGENKIYKFHRYKQNATFTPWAQVYDSVNNIMQGQLRATDNTFDNALLSSNPTRTNDANGDTWIFADAKSSSTSKFGIMHDQLADIIRFYGMNSSKLSVNLNNGDLASTGNVVANGDVEGKTSIKTGNWVLKTDTTTKSLNFIYEV